MAQNEETAKQMIQMITYREHYCVMEILYALDKTGVLKQLRAVEEMSAKEIAQRLSLNEKMLEAALIFLWSATPLIERNNGKFRLVREGSTDFLDVSLSYIGAYRPVFVNLAALLSGDMIYGEDIIRDGYKLQLFSSYYISRSGVISNITNKLLENNIQIMVDLGCGPGQFLIQYCNANPAIIGLGIDLDAVIVEEARKNIAAAGLNKRITIIEGDLRNVNKIKNFCPKEKKLAFELAGTLHEFLRDGQAGVITLLNDFKRAFPNSLLFIAEYNSPPTKKILAEDNFLARANAFYRLIHPLSLQGDPQSFSAWREIIAKSKAKIESAELLERNFILFTLRL